MKLSDLPPGVSPFDPHINPSEKDDGQVECAECGIYWEDHAVPGDADFHQFVWPEFAESEPGE